MLRSLTPLKMLALSGFAETINRFSDVQKTQEPLRVLRVRLCVASVGRNELLSISGSERG